MFLERRHDPAQSAAEETVPVSPISSIPARVTQGESIQPNSNLLFLLKLRLLEISQSQPVDRPCLASDDTHFRPDASWENHQEQRAV